MPPTAEDDAMDRLDTLGFFTNGAATQGRFNAVLGRFGNLMDTERGVRGNPNGKHVEIAHINGEGPFRAAIEADILAHPTTKADFSIFDIWWVDEYGGEEAEYGLKLWVELGMGDGGAPMRYVYAWGNATAGRSQDWHRYDDEVL